MYNFLSRYGQLIAFGVGAILTAIFLATAFSNAEEFNTLSESDQMETGIFNFGLYSAIVLTIACAAAILIAGLIFTVLSPKNSIKAIIGLGVILIIFFLAYSTADPKGTGSLARTILEEGIQEKSSKFISGAISTALVLGAGAVLAFVASEVLNLFK
ncbi:MAG: hypothetical protein GVX96_00975 [Bacteroidetes bacterium]|jgi:hypothetical protein|nr:hypothetical protein [Bacteroidota bacterium]